MSKSYLEFLKSKIETAPVSGFSVPYAEDVKAAPHEIEPEISDVLCPSCVYRGGCPEMHPCGKGKSYFDVLMERTGGIASSTNIDERYEAYNKLFYRQRKRGND